jgi:hypothetical protein
MIGYMDFHDYQVGPQDPTVFTDVIDMFGCLTDHDPDFIDYCCSDCCFNGYNEIDSKACFVTGSVNPPFWKKFEGDL